MEVKTFEGLTTSFEAGKTWTIMSGIWNHLKTTWEGTRTELVELVFEEKKYLQDGGRSREGLLNPKTKERKGGNKKPKGLKRAEKQATRPHDHDSPIS